LIINISGTDKNFENPEKVINYNPSRSTDCPDNAEMCHQRQQATDFCQNFLNEYELD